MQVLVTIRSEFYNSDEFGSGKRAICLNTNGHASRLTTAIPNVMIPKAMIMLPHGSEMNCIPKLPISRPVHPIREDTAPVSPFCCSNIKFVDGGRMQLPAIEAGRMHRAKIHGCRFPRMHTKSPPIAIVTKHPQIIFTVLKRRDSNRYIIGPAMLPRALSEK